MVVSGFLFHGQKHQTMKAHGVIHTLAGVEVQRTRRWLWSEGLEDLHKDRELSSAMRGE